MPALSVSVSAFQLWRRVLFKKMVCWLCLDHLSVCCGHLFSFFHLQLRLHTSSSFSASPFNTDFPACSVWRKRRVNLLAVIFCDLPFHFCVPSFHMGILPETRSMHSRVLMSLLFCQFMYMSEFCTAPRDRLSTCKMIFRNHSAEGTR